MDFADESGASDHLLEGIENFRPVDPNRETDIALTQWLKTKASRSDLDVWLLAKGNQVAAYHTAEAGFCVLPDRTSVERLHVVFAARDHDHPDGGKAIVGHISDLARIKALKYVTLDPTDDQTAVVWQRRGFQDSLTHVKDDCSAPEFRMYLRLP